MFVSFESCVIVYIDCIMYYLQYCTISLFVLLVLPTPFSRQKVIVPAVSRLYGSTITSCKIESIHMRGQYNESVDLLYFH